MQMHKTVFLFFLFRIQKDDKERENPKQGGRHKSGSMSVYDDNFVVCW